MERTVPGRGWLVRTLLFLSLEVCLATVKVSVTPQVDVVKGQTARLPCTYTTSEKAPITVVEWYIENASGRQRVAFRSPTDSVQDTNTPLSGRVSMDNDMTLVISNSNPADQRSFICSVIGGAVGTSEAETTLRVFHAPETPTVSGNNQPISISGTSPSEVGTCTSRNGHPEPRIIWFKDSTPLPEVKDPKENMYMVPRVVKESSGLFSVTSTLYMHLQKGDAKAVFHCTVEYTMPQAQIKQQSSNNFTLTLLYPAENVFFTLLNDSPLKEGDDVQLKCSTDGNPQPQFEITKDGNPLKDDSGLLTLEKVRRENNGTYFCLAMDFDATEELSASLVVNIHQEAVELQCKPTSSDMFTLQWMKDGKVLSSKGALALSAVTLDDAGVYVCVASVLSVPGLQNKANVTVIISGKPEIDEPMKAEVGKQGDMVTMKCSAQGHPSPQFTWKPSGKESLEIKGNNYISTVMLEATEVILRDGVTCEATNKHGTESRKIQLEVKSDNTIGANNGAGRAHAQQGGSSGVVIAVVVCVLLLLLLVATLYFLGKKGKMACSKKNKKDAESGEMKQDTLMNKKPGEDDGVEERLNKSGD
ncbi:basal cell adhesion molecule [Electrophorus electricus]|uniref:basal cell adhesion molecule n=1 Tax=Electrophorus electricus TaxID=8005 RepID=UPI0015CFD717|nr:basal cell adhesion molecule [Electrophorus electricus]